MWEFSILNVKTGEENIIFGYSVSDAFKRRPKLIISEWEVLGWEYID